MFYIKVCQRLDSNHGPLYSLCHKHCPVLLQIKFWSRVNALKTELFRQFSKLFMKSSFWTNQFKNAGSSSSTATPDLTMPADLEFVSGGVRSLLRPPMAALLGLAPEFFDKITYNLQPCLRTGYFLLRSHNCILETCCMLLAGARVHEHWWPL